MPKSMRVRVSMNAVVVVTDSGLRYHRYQARDRDWRHWLRTQHARGVFRGR